MQGTGLLKSKEEDLDRRQRIVNAIEGRKSREAVAANTNQYRQMGLEARQGAADAALKNKKDRMDSMNIGRANTLYQNPNITKETTKLNAARSVQSLIDGIQSGELTDSKNIRNQLTNMIATIELGTPGGVADRHEMGIDNLYTRAKDLKGFLTSNPQKTIPPEYLTQLQSEADALGDRAAKNYIALKNSILANADLGGGNPDVDPGQIHKLLKQRSDTFLNSNGYDPESGARTTKRKIHTGGGHAGKIVKVGGTMYKVGADGDTLEEFIQ